MTLPETIHWKRRGVTLKGVPNTLYPGYWEDEEGDLRVTYKAPGDTAAPYRASVTVGSQVLSASGATESEAMERVDWLTEVVARKYAPWLDVGPVAVAPSDSAMEEAPRMRDCAGAHHVSQNLKVMGHRFVCPECGGNEWGSSCVGTMAARLHCHGTRLSYEGPARACTFSVLYEERIKHFVFDVRGVTRAGFDMLSKAEVAPREVLSYRKGAWLYLPVGAEDVAATVHYSEEPCAETGCVGWCWWAAGRWGDARTLTAAQDAAESSLRKRGFL